MAIAFDAATLIASGTGTSFSSSHTSAGSDRIAFVLIQWNSNPSTLGTFTFGGTNMTLVYSVATTTGRYAAVYSLVNQASGSQTVAGSWATSRAYKVYAISYTGVDQVTPYTNSGGDITDSGTYFEDSISSASDKLVVDFAPAYPNFAGGSYTANAGQTSRVAASGADGNHYIGISEKAGAASVAMRWNEGGSYTTRGSHWLFSLNPVSAGTTLPQFQARIIGL